MKKNVKSLIIFTLINIVLFYVAPLFIVDTGSAMTILLCVIPLSVLIASIIYSSLNSFSFGYPLLVALLFTPTIWIFYNESAWVYIPAYGVISLIGNLIGTGIYKFKHKKPTDTEKN